MADLLEMISVSRLCFQIYFEYKIYEIQCDCLVWEKSVRFCPLLLAHSMHRHQMQQREQNQKQILDLRGFSEWQLLGHLSSQLCVLLQKLLDYRN